MSKADIIKSLSKSRYQDGKGGSGEEYWVKESKGRDDETKKSKKGYRNAHFNPFQPWTDPALKAIGKAGKTYGSALKDLSGIPAVAKTVKSVGSKLGRSMVSDGALKSSSDTLRLAERIKRAVKANPGDTRYKELAGRVGKATSKTK